jgi:hypothetical protein
MNTAQRLAAIEQQLSAAGSCEVCEASDARPRTIVVYSDAQQPDDTPCPACGRGPLVVRVVYRPRPAALR